ncbi:hypothetical protein [Kocuria sp. NPDC057446]|uniref:hypothetical protein n=1 Tax=Kocuria sp. NPDC057446 TaxID=3346137 RepID=UPI0036B104E2
MSVSTIRRNKELLREHGAVLDPDGWKVPMSALIASGLMRRTTPPDQPATGAQGAAGTATEDDVHTRLRELERENLELRHRAELEAERRRSAEVLAHERGEALEAERMALRMLTGGQPGAMIATASSDPETASPAAGALRPHLEPEKYAQERTAPRPSWRQRWFR